MTPEVYDWVDDDSLDLDATLRRLRDLEPAQIVTERVAEHVPDATGHFRKIHDMPAPDANVSALFSELQRRVESSTQQVLNEATALRERERQLSHLSATSVSLVASLAAGVAVLSSFFRVETYAIGAVIGLAGAVLGLVLYRSAASARSLSATLYVEAGREVRILQLMSITLLISDANRRDETIAALAERLAEDDLLGEEGQMESAKRAEGVS